MKRNYKVVVFSGVPYETEESNSLGNTRPEDVNIFLFGENLSIELPDGINPTVRFDSKERKLTVDF